MKYLLFVFLCAMATPKIVYTVEPKPNDVTFTVVGQPGFLKINGEGGHLDGSLVESGNKIAGVLTVQMKDFATGIQLRNEHMRDKYLQVDKYPTAKLVLKDQPYTLNQEFNWSGNLTIKKDTRIVSGTARVVELQGLKKLSADFEVSFDDYPSIGVPSYLGVTVAKTVSVHVEAMFK